MALLVSGCAPQPTKPAPTNAVDPAVTDAIADPILVDPQLAGQADGDVVRPAGAPFGAPVPQGAPMPDMAASPLASRMIALAHTRRDFAACDTAVRYTMAWAARLPADLPLPADAQVIEAIGSDAQHCRLRAVGVVQPGTPPLVLSGWQTLASGAGYVVDSAGAGAIFGHRSDGAAIAIAVTPVEGGSATDIVVNRGR